VGIMYGVYTMTAGQGEVTESSIAMTNYDNPVLRVRHSELEEDHSHGTSLYRRMCPLCEVGFLLMRRDNDFKLEAIDHCILCAQPFEYIDIAELNGM